MRSAVFYKGDKTLISEIFNHHNHDWVYANEAINLAYFYVKGFLLTEKQKHPLGVNLLR